MGKPCNACYKHYKWIARGSCNTSSCCRINAATELVQLSFAYDCKCGRIQPQHFLPEVVEAPAYPPMPPEPPPIPIMEPPVPPPEILPPPPPPVVPPPMVQPPQCANFAPNVPLHTDLGTFWVINESSLPNADIDSMIQLQQLQIDHDFTPKWGIKCTLERTTSPAFIGFNVYVKDGKSDVAGACAYHTSARNGYVFVGDQTGCGSWEHGFSHEVLEMLGNPRPGLFPFGNWSSEVDYIGKTGRFIQEVCDPVNVPAYNQGKLSNFVYPSWFVAGSPCPWDRLQILTGPLTIAPWGNMLFRESGFVPTFWQARNLNGVQVLAPP